MLGNAIAYVTVILCDVYVEVVFVDLMLMFRGIIGFDTILLLSFLRRYKVADTMVTSLRMFVM